MSAFVPGLELSRSFYGEVVAPLMATIAHSAALIGPGSEVLEFDTERSADHDWGPRVLLFVHPGDLADTQARISAGLPPSFGGYPTVFPQHGQVRHGVSVTETRTWMTQRLGFAPANPRRPLEATDWLSASWQSLAEITCGQVFHDGLGELEKTRAALRWYPDDLWRYVMACQWHRIAQEEHFPGRCGEVGDELGSAVVGARLTREVMRLALLMRRRYPPYAKWLGSALARLPGSTELAEALARAGAARCWQDREEGLCAAYTRLASLHNRLGLTEPLDGRARPFHDRPFQVIDADRFAHALRDTIADPHVRELPLLGCLDQLTDNVDLLMDPPRARALTGATLALPHLTRVHEA